MERLGKVSESDRKFDVEFWQRQGSTAIFSAAWEMVVEAQRWKRKSESEPGDLIANKRMTGRTTDLADCERLEEAAVPIRRSNPIDPTEKADALTAIV